MRSNGNRSRSTVASSANSLKAKCALSDRLRDAAIFTAHIFCSWSSSPPRRRIVEKLHKRQDRLQIKLYDNRCLFLGALSKGGVMGGILAAESGGRKQQPANVQHYVVNIHEHYLGGFESRIELPTGIRSYIVDNNDPKLKLYEHLNSDTNSLGIGIIKDIAYTYSPFTMPLANFQSRPTEQELWRLTGDSVVFPHWIVLLTTGSLFTLLWLGRQFTLRKN